MRSWEAVAELRMTVWKLTLSYDGSPFHGWQVQPDRPTVQGSLAAALEQVTGERVLPQGSGRTDAGVHALGQVASFALQSAIPPGNLLRALNRVLPSSIRVGAAEIAAEGFHARHSAIAKTYEYRIFERRRSSAVPAPADSDTAQSSSSAVPDAQRLGSSPERICSPFLAPFVWDCRWPLQLEPMQQAAALFCGTHDFTSFAASDPELPRREMGASDDPRRNAVKTIFQSSCYREQDLLLYRVTGSGFLHHMVRNLAGTLVEVGRGRLAAEAIPHVLADRSRAAAGPTAPASGLFLVQVEYGPREAALSEGKAALSEGKAALSENRSALSENRSALSKARSALSENKSALSKDEAAPSRNPQAVSREP